ncbi:MAG TPA: dipeptidase [Chitinophagaceae bacterium]|nr:dipeptidase [Chitinophagaceae bacterium]
MSSISFAQSPKIHFKSVLIDTHNDVISTITMKGMNVEDDLKGKAHSDLARFKQGGVDVQIFSIFCDERFGKDTAYKYANIEIDSLYAIVKRNSDKIQIATNNKEIKSALKNGKIAAMMGVEGGHMIEDNLEYLEALYNRGVRYMTLTWNNSTSWASSAKDETANTVPNPSKGLNDFGRQVVRKMNELGMIVDLSHVGEQTFHDAISISSKPVIASHSNAYSLCPVPRNLKDDQILAIGKNGGVIHLNFYSGFVDTDYNKQYNAFVATHKSETDSLINLKWPTYEIDDLFTKKYAKEFEAMRPPLSKLLDHLDYIVNLIGVDHVGIGSDFDGINSAPVGLDGVESFPILTQALIDRGYSKKEIRKILGGNFLRVLKAQ